MVSSLDNWDGGLSKTVKQNSARITGSLDSNHPGISALNKTTTIQDERINVPTRLGWQNTKLDVNFTNDASNLNQPLSRNGIIQRSVVPPPNGITTSSSTSAWKTDKKIGSSPVVPTPVVLTVTSTGRSPPSSMNLDHLETVSTYSADGEGDDEAEVEEITIVHDAISTVPVSPSRECPLSMPPPEEEWNTRPINSLFTPSPSPKQTQAELSDVHRQSHSRMIMSHIEVPPFKRPRSDYRPFPAAHSSIVNKRRVPPGPPSTAQVLQASFQHNADVEVLFYDGLEKKKRKLTKRNGDGEVIVVAGPSSTKERLKRSSMDDDDWDAPSKSKKRSHPSSVVDLTISDDNEQVGAPKVKPIPKQTPNSISKSLPGPRPARKPRSIHAAYNFETDVVTLCIEDIRPVPLEVLTLNTLVWRQSQGNVNKGVSVPEGNRLARLNINRRRQNGSRSCILSNSSSIEDTVEEISVGGVIWELAEEDIDKEVIEISSDSDAKENIPQKHVNMPSVPTSQVLPPIPNVGLKNQHQKRPQESYHHRRQQPKQRRQSAGDDVNRSSSTFKAPYEKVAPSSPPLPRATSSSTKVSPATRQRKQPRKKGQILGGDIGSFMAFNTPHKPVVRSSLPSPHVQPSTPKVNVTPKSQKKPRDSQLGLPSSGIKSFPTSPGPSHASPGRPPHSARSALKGYNPDSGSEFPMPSAKALGKRRAMSPTTVSPSSLQRPDHAPVPSYFAASIRDAQLSSRLPATTPPLHDPYAVQNSDFNTFIDLSTSYIPLDASYLYDQSSESQNLPESHIGLDTHLPTHAHAHVYNSQPEPESRGESFISSADSFYNDAGFPGTEQPHYDITTLDNSWSASLATNNSEGQYAYDTIDPTLLGGGALAEVEPVSGMDVDMMDTELDLVGLGAEFETELDDQVQQKDSSQFSSKESSPSSSTDSSSSSFGSIRAKKTLGSASASRVPAVDKEPRKEEENKRQLPPRIRTKRVMPNMISHDEIDMLRKRRRFTLSASSAPDADASSSASTPDDDSEDDKPTTIRKPPIHKPKAQKLLKPPRTRSISPPIERKRMTTVPQVDKNQNWQMDEEDSYCHQCRRKTFYAKMTCFKCQKKFCVRCYAFRYPDCEFDADDEDYSCPVCEGFCNCTACCRKRGETYVGPRSDHNKVLDSPPLPSPQHALNTDVIRVKSSGKQTNLPRPTRAKVIPTTTIPKGATQAWGSLYSVTGEKIGACFFDPSAEDKASSVVFAPATTSILTTITNVAPQQQQVVAMEPVAMVEAPKECHQPEKIRVKKMKRRIFIGTVQPCWGYTKPKSKLVKTEPYAKRSYNAMPRYYVGKRKYLFYPVEDDESSLTSMSESDELKDPEGSDLEGKSFSPDSLGDGDITRAILLGLNACGVAAIEVPAAT